MSNFELIIQPTTTPVAFYIFGYPVRYYGLIITVSMIVGFFLIGRFLEKRYSTIEYDKFIDYSIYLVIFSLIGARLFYVLGSIGFYLDNPSEIIMLHHGGISIWGCIIFGFLGLYILSKIFKFSFSPHSACILVFLPLCQAIGRFGNYFNQEAFGAPSNCFIKLFVESSYRPKEFIDVPYFHPAFLYESILDLIIFVILLLTFKKDYPKVTIFLYLILYSIARLLVESIRIDSILNISSIPVASVISSVALVIGIVGLILSLKKPQN